MEMNQFLNPTPQLIVLCPEPDKCSEKGCDEKPLFAYLGKGNKQFKFCCNTHKSVLNTVRTLELDDTVNYIKKRKRKMYSQWEGQL